MDTMRDLVRWTLAAIATAVLFLYLFVGRPAWAGANVTYTDESDAVTDVKPLGPDGRFEYRVRVPPHPATASEWETTASVLVNDDTGQMQSLCLDVASNPTIATTVAVTSEIVVAAQPIVTVRGTAFSQPNCAGTQSAVSNPITVEFVPEPPGLLGPLAE